MTTVTATEARKQLYKLLDDVSDSHEPVQITGKRGNAVLVGEDDWRAVQEDAVPRVRSGHARVHHRGPGDACGGTRQRASLVSWRLVYTKQAQKDAEKLAAAGLKPKAQALLAILAENPYPTPPPFEKLVGDLSGAYSRRISIQHRLVYQVLDDSQTVKGAPNVDALPVGELRTIPPTRIDPGGRLTCDRISFVAPSPSSCR